MKQILRINVGVTGFQSVKGSRRQVNMVFFSGDAEGDSFKGSVAGTGTDTQTIDESGMRLSARYMLEGADSAGARCRVFIENNGSADGGYKPVITTDSAALSAWETADLTAEITPVDGGVTVDIFARE